MRFTLERNCWYGFTMWPGYGQTYYSPIEVLDVTPLQQGTGRFDLAFFNLGYDLR